MKYLLTFKPLKHFFFGNERTFREDYVAVSEYFPQPTQLLGALRLMVAEQHGLIKQYRNGRYPRRPKLVTDLTGTAKAHTFMQNDDLGKIKSLSSMFLVNTVLDDAYFPTPFDVNIQTRESSSTTMEEATLSYCHLARIGDYNYLDGYDVKNHSHQMLGNTSFWQAYLNENESCMNAVQPYSYDEKTNQGIFVSHTQVGIALKHKQTIKGKFYSKTDYTLAEGFSFACVFDFDGPLQDAIVQLGAESSLFEVKVNSLEETTLVNHPVIVKLATPLEVGQKLVALSDVMLPDTALLNARFTLIPYLKRMASVKMEKGRFVGLHTVKQIVPSGSVVFLKENEKPSLHIGAYGKMGYNQFITI